MKNSQNQLTEITFPLVITDQRNHEIISNMRNSVFVLIFGSEYVR